MSEQVEGISVKVLVNDVAGRDLREEHGLALWIEVAGQRLLFDTGQGGALVANAEALGVALERADALILSHGHYDHTGGLPQLLARRPGLPVYLHPDVMAARYSLRGGEAKAIDMPEDARAALELQREALRWVTGPIELGEGFGLSGPIPRESGFEDTGGPFFKDRRGEQPDPIDDDLALWLRTPRGLVVIVGCSHAGLINTLRQVQRVSGEPRLHAVLGGFHLLEAQEARLARTAEALLALDPELIMPCHCTGAGAVEQLRQRLGERVRPVCAGEVLELGGE
jgi:7,8-dihydropterin-6-yl-methyl-4-(beta-D-ribofuranosyl)aminobenzene 5'-phosphate synthase